MTTVISFKWTSFMLVCMLLVIISSTALTQEIESSTAQMSVDLNLIAEVERDNGNVFSFYEPEPGFVIWIELGSYPNATLGTKIPLNYMTVIEIYEYLEPDKDIPEALLEARERQKEAMEDADKYYDAHYYERTQTPVAEAEAREDDSGAEDPSNAKGGTTHPSESECPCSWVASHLNACRGNLDWAVNWYHRTGSGWYVRNDNHKTDTGACSYRGNISYRLKYRRWWAWTMIIVYLHTGDHVSLGLDDSVFDYDVDSKVYEATGDGYHHCGRGDY